MSNVIASAVLAAGLRTEFADTYMKIKRTSDSRLDIVMDTVPSTKRTETYGYFNAAPHMEFWRRGDPIPKDAFGSVSFSVTNLNWGRRVQWHADDRKDDQTGTLMDAARMAGRSAGLLKERTFFDLLLSGSGLLPYVPTAPDGAAFFATTANGSNRFGVSSGNLLTGTGVASTTTIIADYYSAIEQFKLMQDGKGQPLHDEAATDGEVLVIYGAGNTQIFEEAFLQLRQGRVMGTDAGTTPSNVVIDSNRNVRLWGTQRITDNDWFVFLVNTPKKPTFLQEREALSEKTALEGDNNSDSVRDTDEEYIQWQMRFNGGIALPYAAIKINN